MFDIGGMPVKCNAEELTRFIFHDYIAETRGHIRHFNQAEQFFIHHDLWYYNMSGFN
jgi:hypothetical protein